MYRLLGTRTAALRRYQARLQRQAAALRRRIEDVSYAIYCRTRKG